MRAEVNRSARELPKWTTTKSSCARRAPSPRATQARITEKAAAPSWRGAKQCSMAAKAINTEAHLREPDAESDAAGLSFVLGQPLPAALLYRRCDPAELPFAVCTELEAAPGPIGQERAV